MIVMISTKLEEYTISIWETLTCPHSKEYSHMPGLGVIEGGVISPKHSMALSLWAATIFCQSFTNKRYPRSFHFLSLLYCDWCLLLIDGVHLSYHSVIKGLLTYLLDAEASNGRAQ